VITCRQFRSSKQVSDVATSLYSNRNVVYKPVHLLVVVLHGVLAKEGLKVFHRPFNASVGPDGTAISAELFESNSSNRIRCALLAMNHHCNISQP